MYPRNMVCFRYIIVNILYEGGGGGGGGGFGDDDDDNDDNDDDDNDNNNNNNNNNKGSVGTEELASLYGFDPLVLTNPGV